MQELNPLHTHTGTGQDGRKLDATRSLDKLGVASSISNGVTIISAIQMFNPTSYFDDINGQWVYEDNELRNARMVVVVPKGATRLQSVSVVCFYGITSPRVLRLGTFIRVRNIGADSYFHDAPFQDFVAPAAFSSAAESVIEIPGDYILGQQNALFTPNAFLFFELGRDGANANDTLGVDLRVSYIKFIFA